MFQAAVSIHYGTACIPSIDVRQKYAKIALGERAVTNISEVYTAEFRAQLTVQKCFMLGRGYGSPDF